MGPVPVTLDNHREQVCKVSIHFLEHFANNNLIKTKLDGSI
jgi:hypothetical protein